MASSYVPPHLRGAARSGGDSPGPSSIDGRGDDRGRGYGGGHGYGGGRDDGRVPRSGSSASFGGGGMNRSPSSTFGSGAQPMSRSASSIRLSNDPPPETVFAKWSPSERVQNLSGDQIADIRQRLNVTVSVAEGQPAIPTPIESFQEMVRGHLVNSGPITFLNLFPSCHLPESAHEHQYRHHNSQVSATHAHPIARNPDRSQRA